jgi:PAS domain S-box-containing protein
MPAFIKELLSNRRQAIVALLILSLGIAATAIYLATKPFPPKEPLRVGVRVLPPYYFMRPDGMPSGLGVDVIEEAARRLKYPVRWVVIGAADTSEQAIMDGRIDLWPSMTVTPQRSSAPRLMGPWWRVPFQYISSLFSRSPGLHITEPWLQSNYFLLSLREKGYEKVRDFSGRPIAFVQSQFQIMLAEKYLSHARLIRLNSAEEALQQVCSGRAEAAFVEARAGQALLLKRPAGCESAEIHFTDVEGASLPVGIASSMVFASQADALRDEVGRMTEDGTLDSIVARWSFITIKETMGIYTLQEARSRTRLSIYGMVVLLVALQVSLWQIYRVRLARRMAEQASMALRTSEERYRSLVENANDVVYTHDLEGNLTSFNRAGEVLLGYSRYEVLGKNIQRLLAPEYVERVRQALERGKAGEEQAPMEVHILGRDGRRLILEINARLIYQDGRPAGVHGIARDVTERRHLEDQLRQAQKMEAVGKLAGGVAHDFNNLLTVIVGYSELLMSRLADEGQEHRMISEIHRAAEQAASLTAQLLAFGRRQVLQPRILDLNAVVSATKKMLERLIGERIRLVTDLNPSIGAVKADPSQVQQVIMNLAVNARDAMPKGGTLTIRTRNQRFERGQTHNDVAVSPGDYVVLSVSDTGCGMEKQIQDRIFEPFFTTKELGKGTGLGLSTVYGIVKQSGGYIWIDSEVNCGSTFAIYLPQVHEPIPAVKVDTTLAASPGTGTVLLVEDEESVRSMAKTCLEMSGYRVLEASDGVEALHIVRSQTAPIDLLLTDVVMPFMTGPELAEQITTLYPRIKVLYMSGYSDGEFEEAAVPPSSGNYLQKPFSPHALTAKLRELSQEAEG